MQVTTETVNKGLIDRMMAILPMLTGGLRNIRVGLSMILGVTRSVGWVGEALRAAG